MPYTVEKTIKLRSRIGGISLSADGSLSVGWDMVDELDGAVESRSRSVPAVDVPPDLAAPLAKLFEWADAKIVTEETAHQDAEAAAIAAKVALK